MLEEWIEDYRCELNDEGIDPSSILSEFVGRVEVYKELLWQLLSNFFSIRVE
jgi:hypothetical protein